MSTTSNVYSRTFNRWKIVYDQLQHILDSFLDECTQLDSTFRQPAGHNWREREETLSRVDEAFVRSETLLAKLHSVRAALGATRNRSHSMVPINKLPTETLIYILSLTDKGCTVDTRRNTIENVHSGIRLASVLLASKGLRQIATSAPKLWTHVDLISGGPYQADCVFYARECFRYSGRRDLHIHIVDVEDEDGHKYSGSGFPRDIINLLVPERSRVATLNIQTTDPNATAIVLGLFGGVSPCRVKRFYLNGFDNDGQHPDHSDYDELFRGDLDSFFSSLKILSIAGPSLPSHDPAHPIVRGLTVLLIDNFFDYRPTTSQLRILLAGCPELRSLSLIFARLQPSLGTIEPVQLLNLEILDLRWARANDLLAMLSLIRPGSREVALSVTLDESDAIILKTREFIEQSRVTRLLLDGGTNCYPQLRVLLEPGSLAILELALPNLSTGDLMNGHILDVTHLPRLHAVHLLRCWTPRNILDDIRQLFQSSTIRVMYVGGVHSVSAFDDIPGACVQYRDYPTICRGDDELEWPTSL